MKSHKAQINGCFVPRCSRSGSPLAGGAGEEHNQSMKLVFGKTLGKLHPGIDKAGFNKED